VTVVIAAVAMYDDVRLWMKENVPGSIEVYLDVPEEERRRRDRKSKRIYDKIGSPALLYDEPKAPDLVVHNHGDVSVADAAERVVSHVLAGKSAADVDHGRTAHWAGFYARDGAPQEPSTFALAVVEDLPPSSAILDVGCGNGRDARFFASRPHDVVGVDVSETAIAVCRELSAGDNPSFVVGDITAVPAAPAFDAVYSRFALHAMTRQEEDTFIAEAVPRLKPRGRLLIECRSINDPLALKGEVISSTERILGHYRRFVVADELVEKVTGAGFEVSELTEAAGLAPHGDDDPVVIRMCAVRR
jgi:SAM-dependent methyltransferase